MVKIPEELISLFSDRQASKVLATVEADGTVQAGVRGRFNVIDEETIAFADVAEVLRRPSFKENQKAAIAIFKLPNHGYQIQGTFQGYQTSGELFEPWAKMMREGSHHMNLLRVGLIRVDEVYSYASEDRSEHGTRIA